VLRGLQWRSGERRQAAQLGGRGARQEGKRESVCPGIRRAGTGEFQVTFIYAALLKRILNPNGCHQNPASVRAPCLSRLSQERGVWAVTLLKWL